MKSNSVQTCVTAKKSTPGKRRIRPPLLPSGISMKRVSQLTALALFMGLAASTTFAAETMPALTLSHLQQQHGVAIDTRLSAYYNGWPQRANGPEGHEPQALNLSARWLGAMSDEQLRGWAKQHQLQADTPLRCTAVLRITPASRRD